ncbi:hypothetical protein FA13DRAFT_1798675 [Coprinellus micaceus]|uniref:Uncharacterized protein n=1 Tax=Coprinellus micaceus TaxID=71717 RepID=A0A4Y7SLD6_COPMI|nr:hypothetical protein FA13DRAFT_1798675 [Coprinellus micaceus]
MHKSHSEPVNRAYNSSSIQSDRHPRLRNTPTHRPLHRPSPSTATILNSTPDIGQVRLSPTPLLNEPTEISVEGLDGLKFRRCLDEDGSPTRTLRRRNPHLKWQGDIPVLPRLRTPFPLALQQPNVQARQLEQLLSSSSECYQEPSKSEAISQWATRVGLSEGEIQSMVTLANGSVETMKSESKGIAGELGDYVGEYEVPIANADSFSSHGMETSVFTTSRDNKNSIQSAGPPPLRMHQSLLANITDFLQFNSSNIAATVIKARKEDVPYIEREIRRRGIHASPVSVPPSAQPAMSSDSLHANSLHRIPPSDSFVYVAISKSAKLLGEAADAGLKLVSKQEQPIAAKGQGNEMAVYGHAEPSRNAEFTSTMMNTTTVCSIILLSFTIYVIFFSAVPFTMDLHVARG